MVIDQSLQRQGPRFVQEFFKLLKLDALQDAFDELTAIQFQRSTVGSQQQMFQEVSTFLVAEHRSPLGSLAKPNQVFVAPAGSLSVREGPLQYLRKR